MSFTTPEPLTGVELYDSGEDDGDVKINEIGVAVLDFCSPTVQSMAVTDPSTLTPTDGQKWVIAATAVGVWTGKEGQIAAWRDGWVYFTPPEGDLRVDLATKKLYVLNSVGAYEVWPSGASAYT